MDIFEFLEKQNPWLLAIAADLAMLLPIFDVIITLPLQYALWNKRSDVAMSVNMLYDIVGDIAIPGVGDIIPLNTIVLTLNELDII
ncbi:MAG: hypothetical protein V5A63_18900 [Bacteroides sp.]|uniref:hypothetical protein n=1 Tax=Bacteroides sp. TaxID=29523 RepID=UPI002FC2A47F